MIIGMLEDAARFLAILVSLAALLATYPRTRRTAYAVARYGKLHMSPWMLAVTAACLAIPGPLDELVVFPLLVALTLRTRRNRVILARYVRTAWR